MSAVIAATDTAVIAGGAAVISAAVTEHVAAPVAPLVEVLDADGLRARIASAAAAMGGDDDLVPPATELAPAELRGALEALLLVATKPLHEDRLVTLLPGVQPAYLAGFLEGMAARCDHEIRGWALRRHAGGWQLLTRPVFHPWVRQLDRKELPTSLSRSAFETLAIVAYKQPVTRGAIEDIRGVQCGPMLRQLMDLKLVQVVGRDDQLLGRPLLYGTTEIFLDRFGLGSPEDLPRRHELGG